MADGGRFYALRGWNAVVGAVLLVAIELLLVIAMTAPMPQTLAPAATALLADGADAARRDDAHVHRSASTLEGLVLELSAERDRFGIGVFLGFCLLAFSFAISGSVFELLWRPAAAGLLALPTALLVLGAVGGPRTYVALLLAHVALGMWFLDGHLAHVPIGKRAAYICYGGAWVALTIDAIGRHTSLGFAKDIPLHPALGAFNDFRILILAGVATFWMVAAFLSVYLEEKRWIAALNNPFSATPSRGAWGGLVDGLEVLAFASWAVFDIARRGCGNAWVLIRSYASHLGRDYMRPLFDTAYLVPLLRFVTSVALIAGASLSAMHLSAVAGEYLRQPSGIAELALGPLQASNQHGDMARELRSVGLLFAFIVAVAGGIVFQAWNWSVGGRDVTGRTVIVVGVILVSFPVTGVLGTVLAWLDVGLVGPSFRYLGLVAAFVMAIVAVALVGLIASPRRE